MLKQLEPFANHSDYKQAEESLFAQALLLAEKKEINWKRVSRHELQAEVSLGIPGEDALPTKIVFFQGGNGYYFHLGDKEGPCRNDRNKVVGNLAKEFFGWDGHSSGLDAN